MFPQVHFSFELLFTYVHYNVLHPIFRKFITTPKYNLLYLLLVSLRRSATDLSPAHWFWAPTCSALAARARSNRTYVEPLRQNCYKTSCGAACLSATSFANRAPKVRRVAQDDRLSQPSPRGRLLPLPIWLRTRPRELVRPQARNA